MLTIGERAPDFTLEQADGPPVALGDVCRAGGRVLLIFLRHLA